MSDFKIVVSCPYCDEYKKAIKIKTNVSNPLSFMMKGFDNVNKIISENADRLIPPFAGTKVHIGRKHKGERNFPKIEIEK